MSSSPSHETDTPPPLSWTVRFVPFVICPALLIYAIYELAIVPDLAHNGRQDDMMAALVLSGLSFFALMIAVIYTVSRYTNHVAHSRACAREAGLGRRIRYHEEMLRLVTDHIPNIIFITDREGRFWFANRETAEQAGTTTADIMGKTIPGVWPSRRADLMLDRIRRAQNAGAPVITVDKQDDAGALHYLQTYHIPLPDTSELHRTVLVTQKDVTDVIIERERQEQIFKQLVDTLIAVVDRRDPYAAGHSIRVGSLAHAIATEMDCDQQSVEACTIAGSLMNLGKVLVPRSILVKAGTLDPEELRLVRKSILTSADILSLISFEVPVIPTLRQVLERYDGQGEPDKRKGENILLTARIVAVANAFVALVSPRAHRGGLSVDAALANLRAEADKAFDSKVIEALAMYLQKNPQERDTLIKPAPEMKNVLFDQDMLSD